MICTMYAPWFGPLPFYANYFLQCCARSELIQWCIASDQCAPINLPQNMFWQCVDESHVIRKVFPYAPIREWRHKLCDLKPFWHLIFSDPRSQHTDFRGWIDWDVYHDLSSLEFNFDAAKFTRGSLCSPLFITRDSSALNVWPVNISDFLNQTSACAWDELFYLKRVDAQIIQQGMTPEIDLFSRANYAVHMYRAKHFPVLYEQWIEKYFNNHKPASAGFLLGEK